ncbi:MAG: hypothetical protein WHU94_12180 [Thermogemmata sp.]
MVRQSTLRVSLCVLAIFFSGALQADEHPYAHVRVGDYATYTLKMKVAHLTMEGVVTQTVIAKTNQEVTIKTTGKLSYMGSPQVLPPREQKIDLTKPYDPTKFSPQLPQGAEVQVQKLHEGREKIVVGDKSYECTWTEYRIQAKSPGVNLNSHVKVWMCKNVPMEMVKMVLKVSLRDQSMETVMELQESGSSR